MVQRPEISQVLAQIRSMQGQLQGQVQASGDDVASGSRISADQFTRPADGRGFGELF